MSNFTTNSTTVYFEPLIPECASEITVADDWNFADADNFAPDSWDYYKVCARMGMFYLCTKSHRLLRRSICCRRPLPVPSLASWRS